MKKKLLLLGAVLLCAVFNAKAQDSAKEGEPKPQNTIEHKVAMGETVMLISKKYRITPQDIYQLNPDAVNGISYNTVLQIPAGKQPAALLKNKPGDVVAHLKNSVVPSDASKQ